MALEKEGNRTYARVADLPSITDIRDGDKFIVHTSSGDRLLDFASLLIPLANVSFNTQFTQMWEYFDANSELFNKIGATTLDVDNLPADKETLSDAVNQLNLNLNALSEQVSMLTASYNALVTALNQQS